MRGEFGAGRATVATLPAPLFQTPRLDRCSTEQSMANSKNDRALHLQVQGAPTLLPLALSEVEGQAVAEGCPSSQGETTATFLRGGR